MAGYYTTERLRQWLADCRDYGVGFDLIGGQAVITHMPEDSFDPEWLEAFWPVYKGRIAAILGEELPIKLRRDGHAA